jgi:mono/diheme cytochrome c family protein
MPYMPVRPALVAAAVTGALMIVGGSDIASAFPSTQKDCSQCHGAAGVFSNPVTAAPSSSVVAPGQTYQLAITMHAPVGGATGTGFWIANSDAGGSTGATTNVFAGGAGQGLLGEWNVTATAPSVPGVYFYKVFGQSGPSGPAGDPGFASFSIEVAAPSPSATVGAGAPTATGSPASGIATPTPTPTPAASSCIASCDGQPKVTVDQILAGIGILLSGGDGVACPGFDLNGDMAVTLDEVFIGLDASLYGCPSELPSPPPTATPTVSNVVSGEDLYVAYCAVCHERTSPGYVGTEVYGESAHDISEALAEVPAMQGLSTVLDADDIARIADYLRSLGGGDD